MEQLEYRNFFQYSGGGSGVQVGPLGTAATNGPIMPAPGDYDDGQIGTPRKLVAVPLCPPQIPHAART
jgi:hypothetical protein